MGQQASLPQEITDQLSRFNLQPKTYAEHAVLHAVISGDEAKCLPPGRKKSQPNDASTWSPDQNISALFMQGLIDHVLVGRRETVSRLEVSYARFPDGLILSGLTLPALLVSFKNCRFDQDLDASVSHLLSLIFSASWVTGFYAAALAVDKDLVLASLQCHRKIDLTGARVDGSLDADNCIVGSAITEKDTKLTPADVGVDAFNLNVGGNTLFTGGRIYGPVYLYGATIGGTLDFGGAQMDGLGSYTVRLEKTTVQGSMLMWAIKDENHQLKPFRSAGCVQVMNSTIKNGVVASGGQFWLTTARTDDMACGLVLKFSNFQGNNTFTNDFHADGVSMQYSDFGVIDFHGGTIGNLGLDMRSVKAREFIDNHSAWPTGKLQIGGFVYDKISDSTSDAESKKLRSGLQDPVSRRLYWIALDSPPSSESYKQYAAVLTNEGNDSGAKQVNEAGQRAAGRTGDAKEKTETWMMWPIGYGYAPENAIYGLLGLTALGWIIYRRNFLAGRITPTECDAYNNFKENGVAPAHYTRFSALVYSLENTFPLVNLGQAAKWQPDPSMKVLDEPAASANANEDGPNRGSRRVLWARQMMAQRLARQLKVFLWVQILVGWVLATLFIAAIGGLVRK